MSADLLRRAAALMRELAEAATEGPWTTWADPKPGIDKAAVETAWTRGDPEDGGSLVTDWCDLPDAEHIASWHPAVALALADWLDKAARDMQASADDAHAYGEQVRDLTRDFNPALVVARAYLGTDA